MEEERYGIKKTQGNYLPPTDILVVPHEQEEITVKYPPFGSDSLEDDLRDMRKEYFHSEEIPRMFFRKPTTSESISAIHFALKRKLIYEIPQGGILLGWAFETDEGIYVNPPRDQKRNLILDEKILSHYRDMMEESGGIYIFPKDILKKAKDFCFLPREYTICSRRTGDVKEFIGSEFSRSLGHLPESGHKLEEILSIISANTIISTVESPTKGDCVVFGGKSGLSDFDRPCLRAASISQYKGFPKDNTITFNFELEKRRLIMPANVFGVYDSE